MSGSDPSAKRRRVVVFAPDLMDRSRIEAAARAGGLGATVEMAGAIGELIRLAAGADLVMVDLSRPGILEALPRLAPVACTGFASHVDRELLDAARAAGCSTVLARSAFFRRLPQLLASGGDDPGGGSPDPDGPDT